LERALRIERQNSDHSIYYETIDGNTQKPWLVFLHEGLGCIPLWRDFPERLCRRSGCPGLVYDRTGYGRSSRLSAPRTIHYMHDYALNELPQVLETVIPGRPFILIGHSDGGSIALIHAAQRLTLLKGVVTEAAHVFVESETLEGIRQADEAYDRGKLKGLGKYHGEKTHEIFKAWSETWLNHWFKHWSLEYLLPSIECPMLIIQGVDDQYGSRQQVESIVSRSSGFSEPFLVENCGHTPHLQQPEIVLERMGEFIEKFNSE